MRHIAVSVFVLQFAFSSSGFAQNKAAGFAGKWLRDDMIAQDGSHLPRVTWEITFDEKTMTLRELSDNPEDTRIFVFNLDGTDTRADIPHRPGRQVTYRLKKLEAKRIEITEILPASGSFGMSVTEIWTLENHGNSLSVVRQFHPADPKSPIQVADQKYSFQRVPPSSAP
jgi:hypothetical protein